MVTFIDDKTDVIQLVKNPKRSTESKKLPENVEIYDFDLSDLPCFGNFFKQNCEKIILVGLTKTDQDLNDENMEIDSKYTPKLYRYQQQPQDQNITGLVAVGNPMEVSMLDFEQISKEAETADANDIPGLIFNSANIPLKPVDVTTGSKIIESLDSGRLYLKLSPLMAKYNNPVVLVLCDALDKNRSVGWAKLKDSLFEIFGYGSFDQPLISTFGFLSQSFKSHYSLNEVKYMSKYECLSQPYKAIFCPDSWTNQIEDYLNDTPENQKIRAQDYDKEMVRGSLNLSASWTIKKELIDEYNNQPKMKPVIPIKFFASPDMNSDINLTVGPGWLDPRVDSIDRSIMFRLIYKAILRNESRENHFSSNALQMDLINEFESALEQNMASFRFEQDIFEFGFDFLIKAKSTTTLTQLFDLIKKTTKALKTVEQTKAIYSQVGMDKGVVLILLAISRLRKEIINEWSLISPTIPESLSDNMDDSSPLERLHALLPYHLALQSYNLCATFFDNNTFLAHLLQKFVSVHQNTSFENVGQKSTTVTIQSCHSNNLVFSFANLMEWTAVCHYDSTGMRSFGNIKNSRSLGVFLSRQRFLDYHPTNGLEYDDEYPLQVLEEGASSFYGCVMRSSEVDKPTAGVKRYI